MEFIVNNKFTLCACKREILCFTCHKFIYWEILCILTEGRTYEYDEKNPASLLWERGVIPEYEGE